MKKSTNSGRPRTRPTATTTTIAAALTTITPTVTRPKTAGISAIPTPTATARPFGGAKPRVNSNCRFPSTITTGNTAPSSSRKASEKPTGSSSSSSGSLSKSEHHPVSRIPGTSIKRKLSIASRSKTANFGGITSKREKTDPDRVRTAIAGGGRKRIERGIPSKISSAGSKESVESESGNLDQLEKEKMDLERRMSELIHNAETKKVEVMTLKIEIGRLKEQQKSRSETVLLEIETLHAENRLLRDRLEELGFPLGHGALSDTEKELLLSKKCNSAPPSISGAQSTGLASYKIGCDGEAMEAESDGGLGEYASMEHATSERGSLEWDNKSSSSVSEISVACLQDRILQMEETHYSTSEELQATLQELSDLQDQLTELQNDNERLSDEKAMFLESLCSKVQQLEESRTQVDSLRQLLLQQHGDGKLPVLGTSDREKKLLELLKCAQEEKAVLLQKIEDVKREVGHGKEEVAEARLQAASTLDRTRLLESMVESANADKRLLERQFGECKEHLSNEGIETNRIRMLLDTERAKVLELQQTRLVQDKSELDELLDEARKEKDRLEGRATELQEQLALSQCEAMRLKEQLSVHQEATMVAKNNAKKQTSDLEYKLQQVTAAKDDMHTQVIDLREVVHELERKCQRHLEDKRDLRATIGELQKQLNESTGRAELVQRQLEELGQKHDRETEEWKQFQNDLLMTVRVANDFKTEAQQDVERFAVEIHRLSDHIQSLEAENERLKAMKTTTSPTFHRKPMREMSSSSSSSFSDCNVLMSSVVEQEIVSLRQGRPPRPDTRQSVKSLIESIENASQQTNGSANGAAVTTVVPTSPSRTTSPGMSGQSSPEKSPLAPILKRHDADIYIKPPMSIDGSSSILRDQKNQANSSAMQSLFRPSNGGTKTSSVTERNNVSSPPSSCRGDSDLPALKPAAVVSPTPVSILTNKVDVVKRPSYGDSNNDKKDPLAMLARGGGSRRNALLKWCQNKTLGYSGIEITNFSSSWNDGLAFCALLNTYLPDLVPYETLDNKDKRRNFTLAFQAAESVGIPTLLNTSEMISTERPDWQSVMSYVTSIYKHFET